MIIYGGRLVRAIFVFLVGPMVGGDPFAIKVSEVV